MALDIKQIRARLNQLKSQTNKQDNLWKPKGKTQIRIVPYRFDPNMPFIELLFHYDLGGKTYLSPKSFGRPDPVVEFAEQLKMSGDKDDYKLARKLEPKLRTFVPMILRGEIDRDGKLKQNTGDNTVKFWGFGKTVYQDILGYMDDPDYGDIVDVETGRDLVVEFKTAEETGKSFPETKIRPKPNQTTLTDDSNVLKEMITTQKNITELYKEYTYEELKEVLTKWLDGDSAEETHETTQTQEPKTEEKKESVVPDDTKVATDKKSIKSEFDDLFNN